MGLGSERDQENMHQTLMQQLCSVEGILRQGQSLCLRLPSGGSVSALGEVAIKRGGAVD